jgi:glycosyltransferase involved in cell wall biosynthesis
MSLFGRSSQKATHIHTGRQSFLQRIGTWLRGNLLIPDPRVFWVRPSVRFLTDFIKDNAIWTVITTGPPHSVHLIGLRLKKMNPQLHWIADFRDPWSQWGFLDSLGTGSLARRMHRYLEGRVLSTANEVITITPFYAEQFGHLAHRKVTLLTNGYDEDDFYGMELKPGPGFMIRHVGTVNEKCDPLPFLAAIKELLTDDPTGYPSLCIEFVGEVHPRILEAVQHDRVLSMLVQFRPSVPHNELIALYGSSNLLLIILTGYKDAEGYLPGKLFEYLATGLPVLGVGPERGDAASLLSETGAGVMIETNKTSLIKEHVAKLYNKWAETEPTPVARKPYREYERRTITGKLAERLR